MKVSSWDDATGQDARPPLPGYRLSKLEVFNWGTFDGEVYSVSPRGQTTLLVGENGSGKSTLVDALLTLLVRPQTRNYNVAAGATKNERDEKTYVRGAYDRTIGESGRPQIQYLRSGSGHFTALLACFANEALQTSFSIAQVLYLNHENAVEKVYAFADGEKGIVQDLSDIATGSGIAKGLRDRGFETTTSYKQYVGWIQRETGFRSKAMDIFNQTVAVKDVQRLDLFIRQHMLEPKPWKDRVERLLAHFNELSEAHRLLVRVRQQDELLRPVAESARKYRTHKLEWEEATRRTEASSLFFDRESQKLLEPLCHQWTQQIQFLTSEIGRLDGLQDRLRNDIARLTIEMENAGGDRLRQLPGLIDQADQIGKVKATVRHRFESQLQMAGMKPLVTSPAQFHKFRTQMLARRTQLVDQRNELRSSCQKLTIEMGTLTSQLDEERRELLALEKRRSNLPESLIAVRNSICRELKISVSDLPFVAELIAVDPRQRDWEASIELVLHGFARSLLVSSEYYSRVASYVDRTRLADGRGLGQRLVYLQVAERSEPRPVAKSHKPALTDKLLYRDDHPLAEWVRAELLQRFDFQACESIEEFQRAKKAAMTRNRHVKSGSSRHEKDDRTAVGDRRHFVLGWENKQKRLALAESIRLGEEQWIQLSEREKKWTEQIDCISSSIAAIDQALQIEDFDHIDHSRHEYEAAQLRLERQRLEESDDQIKELKLRVSTLKSEAIGYQTDRDEFISQRTMKDREWKDGRRLLEAATLRIDQARESGALAKAEREFDSIRGEIEDRLTLENLARLPSEFTSKLRKQQEDLAERMQPMIRELTSAMTRFLKRFPDEQADLDADVSSLDSFDALYERISRDDLPKHEERFKQRLNEKVLHEIGLLHGDLENDRQEIREKIEQLNQALKLLQWKPGTFMQLEPSDIHDREIQDFRRELAGCLNGVLNGTPEANEAAFSGIEKLVAKLREEGNDRWRQKVIDVRNWFNFAAREIVAETGEVRSYYDGGTGQSGGEKGKLAFLVLVAAIAYQYDLEPDSPNSKRFHFVMVDEMFSRSDDQHAEYALDLFDRFGLQLLIVAPLDAKARVTEPYVGTYLHVIKDKQTNRSELLSITAEELRESVEES